MAMKDKYRYSGAVCIGEGLNLLGREREVMMSDGLERYDGVWKFTSECDAMYVYV